MEDKVFQKFENMYKLQLNKYIFYKLWYYGFIFSRIDKV